MNALESSFVNDYVSRNGASHEPSRRFLDTFIACEEDEECLNSLKPLKVEHRIVSGKQAKLWLKQNTFPTQRLPMNHSIAEYAYMMKNNRFQTTGTIIFLLVGNKEYLGDGQQRLLAQVEVSETMGDMSVGYLVVWYQARDMAHAEQIYRIIDKNSPRTTGALLVASNAHIRWGLEKGDVSNVVRATKVIMAGFASPNLNLKGDLKYDIKDPAYLINMSDEWIESARVYLDIVRLRKRYRGAMHKRIPMSIALVILRYQLEKGQQFFTSVALNDGLRANQSEYQFAQLIMDTSRVSDLFFEDSCIRLARCWNAYYGGRPLSWPRTGSKTGPKKSIGFYLRGTPYSEGWKSRLSNKG